MFTFLNKIKFRDIFMVGFLLVILMFLVFLIYSDYQKKQNLNSIAADLKLKSPKEKIVSFTEYPGQNGQEDTVQYIYGTNQEALAEEYQGIVEDMSKRTPNSQAFLKNIERINDANVKENYVAKFYAGTTFYQAEDNNWFYTEVATTTKTAFLRQTENTLVDNLKGLLGQPVFAATNTTYSGVGDGYVESDGSGWSTQHNATIGDAISYTATTMHIYVEEYSTSRYTIDRVFVPFDTSALDDTVNITAATLNVRPLSTANGDNDGTDFVTVVQTTQASNTALVLEDYDQCGAVSNPTEGVDVGGRKDITSISTAAYLTFTLNATGISWISTTGYTNLGLREGHDALNSTIIDNDYNEVAFYASEQTGTSNDPYLEITYSVFSRVKINGGKIKIDGGKLKLQ